MIALVFFLAACATKPASPPLNEVATTVVQAASDLLTQTAAAASPTPSPTPTPAVEPISEQQLQAIVNKLNSNLGQIELGLAKDATTRNYYIDRGGQHLTDNLVMLLNGEFQITLESGEQWRFSSSDVSAVIPYGSTDPVLHAAAWEVDKTSGDIMWIPKEELTDNPLAMGLKSTETDIATAWRLHEMPDSFLDTKFQGADSTVRWVITDVPQLSVKSILYPKSDMLTPTETTLLYPQVPARSFPYMYQLTDYNNISAFFTFIQQPTATPVSVDQTQSTTKYAQFISAFDSSFLSPSNPSASILQHLDPSYMSSGSYKDQDGNAVQQVFLPYGEFTGTDYMGIVSGSSTHALFPDDPASASQNERIQLLTQGADSGVFKDSYKIVWPTSAVLARTGN